MLWPTLNSLLVKSLKLFSNKSRFFHCNPFLKVFCILWAGTLHYLRITTFLDLLKHFGSNYIFLGYVDCVLLFCTLSPIWCSHTLSLKAAHREIPPWLHEDFFLLRSRLEVRGLLVLLAALLLSRIPWCVTFCSRSTERENPAAKHRNWVTTVFVATQRCFFRLWESR